MLTCIRHTTVLALGFVLFILVLSTCGGGPSEAEIEATVVARIEKKQAEDDALEAKAQAMAKAMVEATAEAAPTATPVPPAPTATAVPPTPITSLGEQLDYGNNTLYYLPSVTEQEAQNLLDYLVFQEFFTSESFNDVQFRKEGGIYEVRAPLREGMDLNDIDISYIIKQAACELEAYVFTGSVLHWVVVRDTFDDILKRYLCF